ncbi:uncharacterized protein LOC116416271 [Nasonia vitripennis]|uniref:BEN domain-containing protein n=1 Tax=Nasonia vitripennis TaxID=7425 RepID=A0A7M7Q2Z9_NASVI|nr:uncharacterized protein LOC116416271 [Nasonia vitripennis]
MTKKAKTNYESGKTSSAGNKTAHNSAQQKFYLKSSIISNLNKSSVESCTNDLLENVFTDEELARSSVTGKPCNATKNQEVAPALDSARMDYVRETVHKFFGKTSKINSRINKAAQNKISTKHKDLKKRKKNSE